MHQMLLYNKTKILIRIYPLVRLYDESFVRGSPMKQHLQ